MSGPGEELADLSAALRALAEDAHLRGARDADPQPWNALAVEDRNAPLDAARRLERVRVDLGECQRCALHRGRSQIVFGVGDPDADLVVCGEAPGYHEDQRGEPFVGPAGEMLDKMLLHVLGLERSEVYILNIVKCRPPKNRNPLPAEVEACMPFLERQLGSLSPKMVLVLGSVAFRSLLGGDEGITRSRGRWHQHGDIPVMPTFHPAYLLRKPADKRLTFEDLKDVRRKYDALGGKRKTG
jgi:uracil-DNA glycosylase